MPLIVQAHSGLGNQLFQAQYAHFLSQRFPKVEVSLRSTHKRDKRLFELENFFYKCDHVKQPLNDNQFESFRNYIFEGARRRHLDKAFFLWDYIEENKALSVNKLQKYENSFRRASIRGYFQDKIFAGDSCFETLLSSGLESRLGIQPREYETVVHIRKGDFVQLASHGPLSNAYFENILENLKSSTSVLHTDAEPSQLSRYLLEFFSTIKYSNSNSSWSLLQDSINCRNFIGSNSTLSWWAAYASERLSIFKPDFVCFPKTWKREDCSAQETLILSNWHLAESIWVD